MDTALNKNLVAPDNNLFADRAHKIALYPKTMGAYVALPRLNPKWNIVKFVIADHRTTKAEVLEGTLLGAQLSMVSLFVEWSPVFVMNRALLGPIQAIEALPPGSKADATNAFIAGIDTEIATTTAIKATPFSDFFRSRN